MKAGALRAHFASLVILLCEVMNGVLVCCASHCVDVGLLLPYLLCHLFTAVCLRSKALKERNTRFCSLSQHVLPQRLCVAHNRHRVLGRSLVEMCLWTLVFASSFLSTVNKSSMLSCPAWRCCVCGDLGLYRWLLCCCFHWRALSGTGQPFVL